MLQYKKVKVELRHQVGTEKINSKLKRKKNAATRSARHCNRIKQQHSV